MLYADVIVPLAVPQAYTYTLPEQWQNVVQGGMRVIVQVGVRKYYTGIVLRLHADTPEEVLRLKPIDEVLDEVPIVLPEQLKLWQWVAQYYMCTTGEVMKTALPAGLKVERETSICRASGADELQVAEGLEMRLWLALTADKPIPIKTLEKTLKHHHLLPIVRRMMAKGLVQIHEQQQRQYKPKTEARIALSEGYFDEAKLNAVFELLHRSPRQAALLTHYLDLAGAATAMRLQNAMMLNPVTKAQLLEGQESGAEAALTQLRKRGILTLVQHRVSRVKHRDFGTFKLRELNPAQQTALAAIQACFAQKEVCLLHGVTSSGKTEVYIELIERTLAAGQQVLYLVPEIALTTQLTERLGRVFGQRMAIYHSRFSDAERTELWLKQVSHTPYPLILGARSALWLPQRHLGLIIVDEEHETSYKQQDPAPRYHARDTALVLAKYLGAKVLLGTATPAVETYHHAQQGKYGLVELHERHGQVSLPKIHVADIAKLRKQRRMEGVFTPELSTAIRDSLMRGEQAILFLNRRGYAPMLECRSCGWTPRCHRCDVSLTYHLRTSQLVCHYCGMQHSKPMQCPQCENTELREMGIGTQKVEAVVAEHFPEARVARLDLDSTRKQASYERIIADFQARKTNLLIGTQMVTKGLDFAHVSTVGVLNADAAMAQPDFRAHERAFQMLLQVAGRAGRRQTQGIVVLQTCHPNLPLVGQIVAADYAAMYAQQMTEREQYLYPPFCRLVYVYLRHRHEAVVANASEWLAAYLRAGFREQLLGPETPYVGRVQSLYIRKLMVKIMPNIPLGKAKNFISEATTALKAETAYRGVVVHFDVDPV
ncbi:MAG: primosomal protein N' [Bacteroidales bacterium]|nr:primosomal protein N' [Bacteroidales bacterium]